MYVGAADQGTVSNLKRHLGGQHQQSVYPIPLPGETPAPSKAVSVSSLGSHRQQSVTSKASQTLLCT